MAARWGRLHSQHRRDKALGCGTCTNSTGASLPSAEFQSKAVIFPQGTQGEVSLYASVYIKHIPAAALLTDISSSTAGDKLTVHHVSRRVVKKKKKEKKLFMLPKHPDLSIRDFIYNSTNEVRNVLFFCVSPSLTECLLMCVSVPRYACV